MAGFAVDAAALTSFGTKFTALGDDSVSQIGVHTAGNCPDVAQ